MIILKNRITGLQMPCMVWRDENGSAVIVRWRMPSPLGPSLAVILPADMDCEEWQLWEADAATLKGLQESGYPWEKVKD